MTKTLVGTPDPEPDKPEIIYCVTDLGPCDSSAFSVPARFLTHQNSSPYVTPGNVTSTAGSGGEYTIVWTS